MRYAGIGPRAAAVVIDGLITGIVIGGIVGVAFGQTYSGHHRAGFNLHGWGLVTYLVLAFGYWIVLEATWGSTLGKRALNLRVVRADGGAISWGQSTGRNLMRIVDAFPYLLPYLVAVIVVAGDDEKRRLGDRVASTRVVYRD